MPSDHACKSDYMLCQGHSQVTSTEKELRRLTTNDVGDSAEVSLLHLI